MQADLTVGPPTEPRVEAEPGDELGQGDELDTLALEEAPHVDESVVRALLRAVGGGLQYAIGDDDVANHWRFSDIELDELTPPLTRYINRRPKLRRAVAHGDEAAIAMVLAGYVGRNLSDGRAAKETRDARERQAADDADRAGADAARPGGWPGAGGANGAGGGDARLGTAP